MAVEVPQTPKRQWLGKQPLLVIGGILLVLLVGGILWLVLKQENAPINAELSKTLSDADAKQSVGDYQGVFKDLTAAEGQAKTTEEKVRLYSDIAAAASSGGNLDKALEYYAKKHELDPATKKEDGYIVGIIYERKNDPQKALEYYRLYAEYLQTLPDGEMTEAQRASIAETIKSLEGQAQ